MLKPQIDVYMGCDAPWEEAETVLFGAPFDSTTSNRPGTRFGPSALRRESYGLELYSPYQDKDLSDCAVLDSGDLELPMGSSVLALEEIEARAAEILSARQAALPAGRGASGDPGCLPGRVQAVPRCAYHPL